jgi:hypothetical protein
VHGALTPSVGRRFFDSGPTIAADADG